MILRTCTLFDVDLLEKWDPNNEMWIDKREYLNKRDGDPFVYMYIGEHKLEPVTWGAIKYIPEEGYILSWFTAPEHRNKGFGGELVRLLADMAGRPIKAKINVNRPFSERLAIRNFMYPEGKMLDSGEKWWIGH